MLSHKQIFQIWPPHHRELLLPAENSYREILLPTDFSESLPALFIMKNFSIKYE
jgi:hypothetical protein